MTDKRLNPEEQIAAQQFLTEINEIFEKYDNIKMTMNMTLYYIFLLMRPEYKEDIFKELSAQFDEAHTYKENKENA